MGTRPEPIAPRRERHRRHEKLERCHPELLDRIVFVSEHAVGLAARHEAFLAPHRVVHDPKPFSPADIQRALRAPR